MDLPWLNRRQWPLPPIYIVSMPPLKITLPPLSLRHEYEFEDQRLWIKIYIALVALLITPTWAVFVVRQIIQEWASLTWPRRIAICAGVVAMNSLWAWAAWSFYV